MAVFPQVVLTTVPLSTSLGSCFATGLSKTTFSIDDPANPPVGDGFTYLVTATNTTEGTLGLGDGGTRSPANLSPACPACTDTDGDGFCVPTDCDDTANTCSTDCTDVDGDGLTVCAGDCDDANDQCTTDCTDVDMDGFCVTTDCNDNDPLVFPGQGC